MERATVNGAELEYEIVGDGEPVLLVHGSLLAESFRPLLDEPALGSLRLIRYHRRGFAGSAGQASGIAQDADDAFALLALLGVESAHVVGHSHGGNVAIQLAQHAPTAVRSLALLEPGASAYIASADKLTKVMAWIAQAFAEHGIEFVLDLYMRAFAGPDYREALSERLGGPVWDAAVGDLSASFEGDEPSELNWSFDVARAAMITCPVLNLRWTGSDAAMAALDSELGTTDLSIPYFEEAQDVVRGWFPHAESVVLPGPHHFALTTDPGPVAETLANFFARRPVHAGR
jgi:pimeloyl-ACP methyl ester carboxylesterase